MAVGVALSEAVYMSNGRTTVRQRTTLAAEKACTLLLLSHLTAGMAFVTTPIAQTFQITQSDCFGPGSHLADALYAGSRQYTVVLT